MKKIVCFFSILLLLSVLLTIDFKVSGADIETTIVIMPDGSIEPSTAPIESSDNVTYTFTENINKTLVVGRNNTIIDGAGFTLQSITQNYGIMLTNISGVTIENININASLAGGLSLTNSLNVTVTGNTIVNASWYDAVWLYYSDNNTISQNSISNCQSAIRLIDANGNIISKNDFLDNNYDVYLNSDFNEVFQNNALFSKTDTFGYNSMTVYGSNNKVYGNIINVLLSGSHDGILVESNYSTVSANNVSGCRDGLELLYSNYTNVYSNIIANCSRWGIEVSGSSNNSITANNLKFNIVSGLLTSTAVGNIISSNTMEGSQYGIQEESGCFNNIFRNNTMTNNKYNFFQEPSYVVTIIEDIDTSNTVNGKPIYYWVNQHDRTVPTDAGYIALRNCSNITVQNCSLSRNGDGILIVSTTNSTITSSNISNNSVGIHFISSSNNSVSENVFTGNDCGLLGDANNTKICENDIMYNTLGFSFSGTNSSVYHNNFINNSKQAGSSFPVGQWDDNYPSGGNYWSDYEGVDSFKGVYQNITGMDGIGDTPYVINSHYNIKDRYPFMNQNGWKAQPNTILSVRGSNDLIYYGVFNSTSSTWSDWTSISGSTAASPSVAICGNELHVVVRGSSYSQIWHSYINLDTNEFSGWTLLDGATPSAPTLSANSTHLCLVVRGNNNVIYYRFYTLSSRTWGSWNAVPNGTTIDTPAAALVGDSLHIAVRGENLNQIWYGKVALTSGTFSGWALLSGATPSGPLLTSNSTHLCLVVRGNNDNIYYRFYNLQPQVWTDWISLPYGTTPDTPAATITGDSLQIVVRGSNNDLIWYGTLNLSSNAWSGWTQLSGSTPSKPVLTS